ncbi:MAG: right-handed parallel beta-helix repeat-containing protein [Candidatus Nanopelagicales bacterium]
MAATAMMAWPTAASAAAVNRDLHEEVAHARPGDTVTLPAGVTRLQRPLAVPRGVTVTGHPDGTVLRIARGAASEFGYSFMIAPASPRATNVTVRNLSLDGSRSRGVPGNTGGGVKAGTGWTIRGVRASNMNYFRIWVYRVSDVRVLDNVFDSRFGMSGGNDNIGGGRSSRVTISGNRFEATSWGNAVDMVAPRDVTVSDNVAVGTPGREHSIYLEGPRGATISGNHLTGSSITVQGDSRYRARGDTVNPTDVRILANTVVDAPAHGIAIKYEDEGGRRVAGGGNMVADNVIADSGVSGVVILHCTPGAGVRSDTITGNSVVDPFARGTHSWGTGCGTVPSNGIAVTGGSAVVTANRVIDSRPAPITEYGIFVGAQRGRVPVGTVTLTDNTGQGLLTGITNR